MPSRSKYFYILCSVIALSAYSYIAFAAGPFAPGATLDPVADFPVDCTGPDDGDCFVQTEEIERGSGAPASTPAGLDPVVYVNEDNGDAYTWDGASWNLLGGGGGAAYELYAENPGVGHADPVASGTNAVAIGADNADYLAGAPTASGVNSFSLGTGTLASGNFSYALGVLSVASAESAVAIGSEAVASGGGAFAFGQRVHATALNTVAFNEQTTASGSRSAAFGNSSTASGNVSFAAGVRTTARSYGESVFGLFTTDYTPASTGGFDEADRLFVVGNGTASGPSASDAVTVLKNGKVGIGIDHFEDTANQIDDGAALLQVDGDIYSTGVQTANLTIMSDRRLKTNIEDLNYGLDAVNALRPVAYDLRSDGSHQYGFIAQEVQGELPILVNDGKYLSLNYIGIIPVLTKAVQELDVKIKAVESQAATVASSGFSLESITSWFADAANGIGDFFAHRVHTDELCVGNTCLNETQVQQILETVGATPSADSDGASSSGESTDDGVVISESEVPPPADNVPEPSPDAPPASSEPDPATA